jgi:TolB protein
MSDYKIGTEALPDWWQREKQRRQLRVLILLSFLLGLIGYFYYINMLGRTGIVNGITGDTSNHIAFVRQEADGSTALYMVRADGTDLVRLTPSSDKSDKSAPAWTMDGKRLLYASNRGDSRKTQIYILGAGEPTQLTYGPERKDNPLAVPDGKHAAFITQGAIKTVYLNGEEVTQLLPAPRSGNEGNADSAAPGEMDPMGPYLSAAFSSDGASVAGVQELSAESAMEQAGFSAGDQVARAFPFGANHAALLNAGRYVSMNWETNGNRLLVSYAERPMPPQKPTTYASGFSLWSFDNPNKPVEKPLLLSEGFGFTPRNIAWSPDGTMVACEAWMLKSEGVRELRGLLIVKLPEQLVITGSAESSKTPVMPLPTGAQGVASNPRWSPDGSRLLFQVTRPDHKNDLWVVNNDFTNPVNLTRGVGDNTQGVWSPAKAK